MAIEITIPRLGWSMEEGIFAGWHKLDGEKVRAGDPLFSLEGEKATQDIDAMDSGILRIPTTGPSAGDTVAVGAIIGFLLQTNEEDAPSSLSPGTVPSNRPRSSPLARRIANEYGIDWTTLRGSGRTGRIRRSDVLEAIQARTSHLKDAAPPQTTTIGPTRRVIAARMRESHQTVVPVTLTMPADATNLCSLRQQFKLTESKDRPAPSYNDILIKLTALALKEHPMLNASLSDDHIVIHDKIHIALAVDTELGLVAPVIRDVQTLGLRQISVITRTLIQRAQERRLSAKEIQDGTFTITNLGSFGVETFTPIVNHPQCAILGIGAIRIHPVMSGDKIIGRKQITLCLTFDHRIVDGTPAARFLQHLVTLVESPAAWLVT